MAEHSIIIKQEVEDPSYNDTHENNTNAETIPSNGFPTEFVDIKKEKDEEHYPLIRQIKEEPLDLTPERPPDSPEVPPDSANLSNGTMDQSEHPVNPGNFLEVEVMVESGPVETNKRGTNKKQNNVRKKKRKEKELLTPEQAKNLTALYIEKSKKDQMKKQFVIEDSKFSCKLCHKMYMTKASIVRHLLQHSEEDFVSPPTLTDTYKCDKCGKTFKSASNLTQHLYIHQDEKQFKCDKCQRSFTLKSNLIRHQGKSQCTLPDEIKQCTLCDKIFYKEHKFQMHMKMHKDRIYSCDNCDMSFKNKNTLIRHIEEHKGNKPYACNVCGKKFTQFGLIKPHMRMHTGEKPFSCPVCLRKFAHKHNMLRHSTRHDKVVKLNCPVCDKKFPKESRLKYHMRTHLDEKCFACGICPKKFTHRQNVIRHYSRKHPNSVYQSTETDASVSLKLWNEVKNKERPFPDPRKVKNVAQNNSEINIKNEITSEIKMKEEILPDVKETTSELNIKIEEEHEDEEILPDIIEKPEIQFEAVCIKVEVEFESESAAV